MMTLNHQKTLNGFYIAGIASIIFMPELMLELSLELFHHVLEALHILFEFLESSLDHVVEHLFHTDLHQTQVIVFYILVSMAATAGYFIWLAIYNFYLQCKNHLMATFLLYKTQLYQHLNHQSLTEKIVIFTAANLGLTCLLMFAF
ncbi:MAG: hypothetical protein WC782_09855 [Methylococcaceae bacterium]|jgi:hypothetical protein